MAGLTILLHLEYVLSCYLPATLAFQLSFVVGMRQAGCFQPKPTLSRLDRIESRLSEIWKGRLIVVGDMMLLGVVATAVCVGCLLPNRWLPPLPNDKLLHFGAFAVLTVLALRVAQGRLEAGWWLVGLLVGGWLIECLQSLVPDRRFCWRDLAANAAGIAAVALPAFAVGNF